MTSKITTYCGAIAASATAVLICNFNETTNKVCLGISAAANAAGLFFARDNKVSDEAAGAKKTP